jgi:hypothetical protein
VAIPTFVFPNKTKPNGLEARVGIGLNYSLLHGKYASFHWLLTINQVNPA